MGMNMVGALVGSAETTKAYLKPQSYQGDRGIFCRF